MAIIPVTPDDVEYFTTVINPVRTYTSSSSGVTGSILLFSRTTHIEKEVRPLENFQKSFHSDDDIDIFRKSILDTIKTRGSGSIFELLNGYVDKVNEQSVSERKRKMIDIGRFTPSVTFTSNTVKKLNIKDMLMPYYRPSYTSYHWAYTNYHSLNFFTGPSVPSSSALLFPNVENSSLPVHEGYVRNIFSFGSI